MKYLSIPFKFLTILLISSVFTLIIGCGDSGEDTPEIIESLNFEVTYNPIIEGSEDRSKIIINLENTHFDKLGSYDSSTFQIKSLPQGVSYQITRVNEQQVEVSLVGNSTINYDTDILSSPILIKPSVLENFDSDSILEKIIFKALIDRDNDGLSDVEELTVYKTNFQIPNEKLDINVAKHRHNAVASMTIDTDQAKVPTIWMTEYLAFKHNIGLTVFDIYDSWSWVPARIKNRKDADIIGRLSWEIYLQTDTWIDPKDSVRIRIPDYYSTIWTTEGTENFIYAVLGETKEARYPNHGQQIWDISGGDFGYDFASDIKAETDVATGIIQLQIENFKAFFGYSPTSISYRNGQTGISNQLKDYVISGRNSSYSQSGDSHIDYSDELENKELISRQSSTRWLTNGGNEFSTTHSIGEIEKAMSTGGFWNNFTHFQLLDTATKQENWQLFFEAIDDATKDEFVYWDGYGEINQYLFLRNSLAEVNAFEDDEGVVIEVKMNESTKGIELFRVPLSFVLDISNSKLSGKELGTGDAVSVRKISTDVFNIEIEPSTFNGSTFIKLYGEPNYLDLSRPIITEVLENAGVVTVKTNQPSYLTFFHNNRGGMEYSVDQMIFRSVKLQKNHVIDFNNEEIRNYQSNLSLEEILLGDVYIGAITSNGQSSSKGPYKWK